MSAASVAASDDGGDCDDENGREEGIIFAPDDTTPIHVFLLRLHAIARAPATEDNWQQFVATMEKVTSVAVDTAKISVQPEGGPSKRKSVNPDDTRGIQTLYRRNRCSAVRSILSGNSVSCEMGVHDTLNHFTRVWSAPSCDTTIFPRLRDAPSYRRDRSRGTRSLNASKSSKTLRRATTA